MDTLSQFLIDLIFPKFCVGCQRLDTYLCVNCYQSINFYSFSSQGQIEPAFINELFILAHYEGVIKKLILELKYHGVKDIGKTLAKMIHYALYLPTVDVMTAVPLHPQRERERGFNQAHQIAQALGEIKHIPVEILLQRTRHLSPQAKIKNKQERLSRLKNSFEPVKSQFSYESVLIIDDVTTTGATLNECAKALKQAGVKKVYGLAIAHGG